MKGMGPIAILIVLVVALTVLLIKTKKDSLHSARLKELVAYSAGESSNKFRYGIDLSSTIANTQKKLTISEEYAIHGEEEWYIAKEIISLYQKFILDKYLSGNIYIPKTKYELSGEDFFVYWLSSFIEQNSTETYMGNYKIRGRIIKQDGNYFSCSDTTYEMTDFGLVLFKLLLVSYYYEKDSKVLNFNPQINIEQLKDAIKAKELVICRR